MNEETVNLGAFIEMRDSLRLELAQIDEDIERLKSRRLEIMQALFVTTPKGYAGPTGTKAESDPQFVQEVIARRTALSLSATMLSQLAGYSAAYLSMVENGSRDASEEAKAKFRSKLDELEQ